MHEFPSPTERSEFAKHWQDATPEMRQAVLQILEATVKRKSVRARTAEARAVGDSQAGEAHGNKKVLPVRGLEEVQKRRSGEFETRPSSRVERAEREMEARVQRARLIAGLREQVRRIVVQEKPAGPPPRLAIDVRRRAARRRAMQWAKACDARNRVLEQRKADDRQRKVQWAVWLFAIYIIVTSVALKIYDVITMPGAAPSPAKPGIIERDPRRVDDAVPGIWWHEVEDKKRESDDDSSMENQGLGPGTPVQVDLGPDEELI